MDSNKWLEGHPTQPGMYVARDWDGTAYPISVLNVGTYFSETGLAYQVTGDRSYYPITDIAKYRPLETQ